MTVAEYKPPVPCACGCGRMVVFDNPNNHNGKFYERKCGARYYRRRFREERAQTIPVPRCVRGKGKKFTILKVPDPDAVVEEGRIIEYQDVMQTLKDGNFDPGTVIRADGRLMVVCGVLGYVQHLKFIDTHGSRGNK